MGGRLPAPAVIGIVALLILGISPALSARSVDTAAPVWGSSPTTLVAHPANNSSSTPPPAPFAYGWTSSVPWAVPGQKVTFQAWFNFSGTIPTSGMFYFGDGTPGVNISPANNFTAVHSFRFNGTFQVSLDLYGSNYTYGMGGEFEVAPETTVNNLTFVMYVTPWETYGSAPLPVNVTCIATGGVAPYYFDVNFGNGNQSLSNATSLSNFVANYAYGKAGFYSLTASVTDSNGTGTEITFTTTIWVTPGWVPPTAQIGPTSSTHGAAPFSVQLQGSFSTGTEYSATPLPFVDWNWSLGDGSTAHGSSVNHTFAKPGDYDVSLTIPYSDAPGNQTNGTRAYLFFANATMSIQVTNGSQSSGNGNSSGNNTGNNSRTSSKALVATASLVSKSGTSSVAAAFVVDVSGGKLPYTIQFNFGDATYGIGAPGATVDHTYAIAGVYHATAVVTDGAGTKIALAFPAVTVHLAPAAGPAFTLSTTSSIYLLVAGMLSLTVATALLVRSRARRDHAALEEGEAIVRELLRPPEP